MNRCHNIRMLSPFLYAQFSSGPHCGGFSAASAGSRLTHYLPALMFAAGIPVATTELCHYNPTVPVQSHPSDETIVVYPECIRGNPLGAKRTVRYFGYWPTVFFGGDMVQKDECAILFLGDYLEEARRHCQHSLEMEDVITIPCIDPVWVFPEQKTIKNLLFSGYPPKRIVQCVPDLEVPCVTLPPRESPQEFDPRVTDHWTAHQRTLAILRRAENVYTQDHISMLNEEAALCGCNVFQVHGPKTFIPVENAAEKASKFVMNPAQDVAIAKRFANRVYKFFGEG